MLPRRKPISGRVAIYIGYSRHGATVKAVDAGDAYVSGALFKTTSLFFNSFRALNASL